eukprot:scaffold14350_cov98-Isochrysis_galbana.AAC.6
MASGWQAWGRAWGSRGSGSARSPRRQRTPGRGCARRARGSPFLRLDSAILRTSNGTTTATSIEARSSRKPPHPALRKSLVMPSA